MRRSYAVFFAVLVGAGCDSARPVSPSPQVPTLSGTVYEHDASGVRAVPNVSLHVQPEGLGADPDVVSDATGRYEIFGMGGGVWFARANFGDALQPCYASAVPAAGTVLDVHVVRESTLAAIGIPPSLPITPGSVTGRVTERTAAGERPVAGVWVSGGGFTKTDRDGQYLLCGLRTGNRIRVSGTDTGYVPAETTIDLDQSTTYDFVLSPR